jgi:hypothetical protein
LEKVEANGKKATTGFDSIVFSRVTATRLGDWRRGYWSSTALLNCTAFDIIPGLETKMAKQRGEERRGEESRVELEGF